MNTSLQSWARYAAVIFPIGFISACSLPPPPPMDLSLDFQALEQLLNDSPPGEVNPELRAKVLAIPEGNLGIETSDFWGTYRIGVDLVREDFKTELFDETSVGVIDVGFDPTIAAIASRVINSELASFPPHAAHHGTHIAGTIAAAGPYSVAGHFNAKLALAPLKKIEDVSVRRFHPFVEGALERHGLQQRLLDSVDKLLTQHGVRVISSSIDFGQDESFGDQLLKRLNPAKAIYVNAAGNIFSDLADHHYTFPDDDDFVFHVSNFHPFGAISPNSNFGAAIFLCAPGEEIFSLDVGFLDETNPTARQMEYEGTALITKGGTSMAAPHVAGVIALIMGINPQLNREDIRKILSDTAIDLGYPGRDPYYGFGLVNAYGASALAQLRKNHSHERALAYLQGRSSQFANQGIAALSTHLRTGEETSLIEAFRNIRRAYFLDPNQLLRRKLHAKLQQHFGFTVDANAALVELYDATGETKYLEQVSNREQYSPWLQRTKQLYEQARLWQKREAVEALTDIRMRLTQTAVLFRDVEKANIGFGASLLFKRRLEDGLLKALQQPEDYRLAFEQYLRANDPDLRSFYEKILFVKVPISQQRTLTPSLRTTYESFAAELISRKPTLGTVSALATMTLSWRDALGLEPDQLKPLLSHENPNIREKAKTMSEKLFNASET